VKCQLSACRQIAGRATVPPPQIDTELAETRADHARESQEIQDHLSEAEIELGLEALGRVVVITGIETGDVIAQSDPTSSGGEADKGGASPSSPILPGGSQ
jgi:hypothetical protein